MRGPLWTLLRALRKARGLRWQRVWAIARKELRDYRRDTSVTVTMAILPLIFVAQPLIEVFSFSASSAHTLREAKPLLYMLGIPALVPAVMASYAVVGERLQGALEPVLTTPVDLGRDRDLYPLLRQPRRQPAAAAGEPAAGRDRGAAVGQCDPRQLDARDPLRRRAAGTGPRRLARGVADARPRAADHRDQVDVAATLRRPARWSAPRPRPPARPH